MIEFQPKPNHFVSQCILLEERRVLLAKLNNDKAATVKVRMEINPPSPSSVNSKDPNCDRVM